MTANADSKEVNYGRRRLIAVALVLVLTVAGYMIMPSNKQAVQPGPTYDLTAASTLPLPYGGDTSTGSWVGLTVYGTPLTNFQAIWNQLAGHQQVIHADGGVEDVSYDQQALASRQSALNAAMSLYTGTEASVMTVASDGTGSLSSGDRVLSINGSPPSVPLSAGQWLVVTGAHDT